MESLSDKLKSLGVKVGTSGITPPKIKKKGYPIEEVIEGLEHTTPFGNTFVVVHDFPLDYNHGITQLSNNLDLELLALWGKSPQLTQLDLSKIVFLDSETSGLAGGTGTFAFMVGIGGMIPEGFRLQQLFLRSPDGESAFLAALIELLSPYEAVVTFNGKSFDIPLLNTRHILNGFDSPFTPLIHLDMLHLARRLWRNRLPSRALGDLEREILGVARTQEEIPGWMVPELYFEYLKSGDARPLKGVFYHNTMDVLSLAALFNHVAELLSNPLANEVPESLDLIAIAALYEELQKLDEAVLVYEASLKQGLPREFFLHTLQRFALLHRKRGEWDSAVSLWTRAAEEGEIDACTELAKYYEHQQADYPTAIYWTEKALQYAQLQLSGYEHRQVSIELDRRLTRLKRHY